MGSLKLALILASSVAYISVVAAVSNEEWSVYKRSFNKSYAANVEDWIRRELYSDTMDEIRKFNVKQGLVSGFKMGINQFSDLTRRELMRLGAVKTSSIGRTNTAEGNRFLQELLHSSQQWPARVDFREQAGRVGRVKNQLRCRSSWPFVVAGVLEGQLASQSPSANFEELSEQNLIDCVGENLGCSSGLVEASFKYVQENGLHSEASYPFTGETGDTCKASKLNQSASLLSVKGYAFLPANEELLERVLAGYGPVGVVINLSNEFIKYKSGIFVDKSGKPESCSSGNETGKHGLVLVGYGSDHLTGRKYFIAKNSWGTRWGEKGYIRLARHRGNNAGISCNAIIPIF